MRRQALPVAAFSAGAVAAGFIHRGLGFWGLLPPIAVLLVLAWAAE
ncbi:hypothetical protein [Ramlibacter humi]|nr:hypothetical protein [Ramlibacter humi]